MPSGTFKLPIQTVTLVPSTKRKNERISQTEMTNRVRMTRKFLSNLFGGYTSVRSTGGYISKNGRLIKERVVAVTAFSQKLGFIQKKQRWFQWIRKKKKEWGQEAIGIIIENDMFYV